MGGVVLQTLVVVNRLTFPKYIISIVLFFPLLVFGNTDSTSFIKHKSKIEVKPYFVTQKLSLKLQGNTSLATYEPGLTGSVGLSVSYKFLGASFGRSVFNEKVGELKEKSEYFDLRLNFSGRRVALDLDFQWFIGFSVSDLPNNISDSLKEFIQPNLDLVNYGVNFYYGLNKKMSIQSIYKYNERQLKSSGSIIVGLKQNFIELSYSSTIFPEEILTDSRIGDIVDSENQGSFFTIIPVVGYQYNLIKEKIHLSPFASVGYGVQYQSYISKSKGNFKGFRNATTINFNLPFGYNGDKIYYGVVGKYNQTISDIQNRGNMNYSLFSLKFFFGIRFK
jgi:hypothetical protein